MVPKKDTILPDKMLNKQVDQKSFKSYATDDIEILIQSHIPAHRYKLQKAFKTFKIWQRKYKDRNTCSIAEK